MTMYIYSHYRGIRKNGLLRYYYEISEELLGTTWDPHGTHTGTHVGPIREPRGNQRAILHRNPGGGPLGPH